MTSPADPPSGDDRRVLVHNPAAGDGAHTDRIHSLAADHGFEVRDTTSGEDVVETAAAAAEAADVVAAAGGDGTLTRAVRGLDRADAFGDTLFAVIPTGTGNNFAGNVGIPDVETGFELVESGERRRIDLGTVDGTPFLNSCVAGLTAEASADTDSEAKERWGVLAYVAETVRTAREFEGVHITVEPADGDARECDAEVALVGNARRFPRTGGSQADVEDGALDVTVLEDGSAVQMVEESIQNALGGETDHVRQFTTPRLRIRFGDGRDRISVDGEIRRARDLTLGVRERTLRLPVGESYRPDPDGT